MEESLAGIEMELSLEEGPEYESSGMSRTLLVEASERTVDQFLGGGNRAREVVLFPQYYALLFGWALEEYLKFIGAKIKRIIGNSEDEPFYTEVYSDYEDKKNILTDGQILVTINNINVVITVSIDNARFDMLMFESREKNSKLIKEIAEGVEEYAKTNNFYRGKNLEFRGSLKMVKLKGKAWDNVVIDEEIKNEIRKNTIGFIKNLKLWEELGIPPKRGYSLKESLELEKLLYAKH